MKRILFTLITSLLAITLWGQAKKPTLMVIPSDVYCMQREYSQTFQNTTGDVTVPDYKKAMQNDNQLRLVITKMGQIMASDGFPLKDLEQTLKTIDQQSTETMVLASSTSGAGIYESPIDVLKKTANADIVLDLDFSIKRRGPDNYIVFNLRGLDAYTNKQIAGVAGEGKPSSSAGADLLLEEAVLSHMDDFKGQLMSHFEDMFENGREVALAVKVWDNSDYLLEDEFDYDGVTDELGIFIEDWVADQAVKGRFSLDVATETQMQFTQLRIPMEYERNGRMRAMDTRRFASNLRTFLRDNFQLESKVYTRGLGEAWIIIGEK